MTNANTEPELPPTMILGITLPRFLLSVYLAGFIAYGAGVAYLAGNTPDQPLVPWLLWQLLYAFMWPLMIWIWIEGWIVTLLH